MFYYLSEFNFIIIYLTELRAVHSTLQGMQQYECPLHTASFPDIYTAMLCLTLHVADEDSKWRLLYNCCLCESFMI